MIDALLDGIEVRTGVDYNESRAGYEGIARKVVYTGPVDAYIDYKLGQLEYHAICLAVEAEFYPDEIGNAHLQH